MGNHTYQIVTKDSIGGERTWLIRDADDEDNASRRAAKTAALDHIADYEEYGSDSDYRKDLDNAAEEIEILDVAEAPGDTGGRPVATGVWLLSENKPVESAAPGILW